MKSQQLRFLLPGCYPCKNDKIVIKKWGNSSFIDCPNALLNFYFFNYFFLPLICWSLVYFGKIYWLSFNDNLANWDNGSFHTISLDQIIICAWIMNPKQQRKKKKKNARKHLENQLHKSTPNLCGKPCSIEENNHRKNPTNPL